MVIIILSILKQMLITPQCTVYLNMEFYEGFTQQKRKVIFLIKKKLF